MSTFWDSTEVIGVLNKNKSEDIIISLCERQGKEYIDIRIYKNISTSDKKVITKNGVVIPKNEFLKEIPNIIDTLTKGEN